MPETFQTIAARIDALARSLDQRFGRVDDRFDRMDERLAQVDQQFEETRAQLGVKIEAVDAKVDRVYDELIAMRAEAKRNTSEHGTFTDLLDNHEIRIVALEKRDPPRP